MHSKKIIHSTPHKHTDVQQLMKNMQIGSRYTKILTYFAFGYREEEWKINEKYISMIYISMFQKRSILNVQILLLTVVTY